MLRRISAFALLVVAPQLIAPPVTAQGTRADYERAFGLSERFTGLLTHDQVEPRWISPTQFFYDSHLGEGVTEQRLFDAETGHSTTEIEPGITEVEPLKAVDRSGTSEPRSEVAQPKATSPDGRWQIELRLGALLLNDTSSDDATRLASAPGRDDTFDLKALWSADSRYVVVNETVTGDGRVVHLIESSPRDQLQPKLHELAYPKPGDAIEWQRPRLFSVEGRSEVPLDPTLFPNPWSIEQIRWKPDSSTFSFVYNQRGHQVVRVLEADAKTGNVRTLVEEAPDTFVHYSEPSKCWLHRLDETGEALWTSERDGWNHLYLLGTGDEPTMKQLTRGPWVVREIVHVDAERRCVWFTAGGVVAGHDPYYRHLCRVGLDGTGFTVLTEGDGDHSVRWSPDGACFLDTYSRVDLPPVTELRRADDGALIGVVERADASALVAAGWRAPECFVAKGREGKTDIYGILCRPTDFDPTKKYPVVEEHYAGPHSAHCPKRFATLLRSQAMADLGFLVVQIDGRGTDQRGKAFHDVCWKNLVDAGLPDRMAWITALAEHEPALDLTRVGIRGTSAGGQTAMAALLHHGDFYRAAVSNCGCHDNRTDKVWWNEQWMGYPVGPHFAEQSNVTQAHKLRGDLMLIVGEMDRNVPPTATLQVVDALIRADKDFEFLFIPGGGHGARGGATGEYTKRRTWDFFVRKLHGVEPRGE